MFDTGVTTSVIQVRVANELGLQLETIQGAHVEFGNIHREKQLSTTTVNIEFE